MRGSLPFELELPSSQFEDLARELGFLKLFVPRALEPEGEIARAGSRFVVMDWLLIVFDVWPIIKYIS